MPDPPPSYGGGRRPTTWSEIDTLRAAEEAGPPRPPAGGAAPKPFTTPPGYVPPTLGEQWLYAQRRHPYYRYGYAGVILLGGLAWWTATATHQKDKSQRHDDGGRGDA